MAWLHTHLHRERHWILKEKPLHWGWVIFALICCGVGAEEHGAAGAITGFFIAACICGLCKGVK